MAYMYISRAMTWLDEHNEGDENAGQKTNRAERQREREEGQQTAGRWMLQWS